MSGQPTFEREVRDTVVKSGLTGVAATVLAVTIFSPAGFGGVIGTSLASGFGLDPNSAASDPYANLPPYPAPLTAEELDDIRSQLARTSASLEITRAATDEKIDRIRSIASVEGAVTFAPMPQTAQIGGGLRLSLSEPVSFTPSTAQAQPVEVAEVIEEAPVESYVATTPVSFTGAGGAETVLYRDRDLEFAQLLLRDTY